MGTGWRLSRASGSSCPADSVPCGGTEKGQGRRCGLNEAGSVVGSTGGVEWEDFGPLLYRVRSLSGRHHVSMPMTESKKRQELKKWVLQ